jgi:DNA polymerase-3 subunit delta
MQTSCTGVLLCKICVAVIDGAAKKVYNKKKEKCKGGARMNPIITEADYRKMIGKTAGHAYLFYGEEDYLKLHAVRQTRESISPDPAFAIFNDVAIDATDYTPDGLLNAMTPPPMMADGRFILLRGLDFTAMKPSEVDALIETLALLPEYDFNTVVLQVASGCIDEGRSAKAPSTILKRLSEVLTPVCFEGVSDARLAAWAGKHFAHHGVQASAADCAFLVSFVGSSMFLLAGEIEKLAYFVRAAGRTDVNEADIRLVCVPQLSSDAFALSNAVMAGRYRDALDALAVMKFQRIEPTIVMGELSKTICEMYAARICLDAGKSAQELAAILGRTHEYRAKLLMKSASTLSLSRLERGVALCADADIALKTSARAAGDYGVIERLICSL